MQLRRSEERGLSQYSWLKSRHSFSFADYFDPRYVGFSALRVINEDDVAPDRGFPTHAHRDMEIISYVLQGCIEHKDSMGYVSQLKAGEAQRMSAGTGITHSEYNPSADEPLKFLQIWILPERNGISPGYETLQVDQQQTEHGLRLLVSPDGRENSMHIHQDMALYRGTLQEGETLEYKMTNTRKAYLHVIDGKTNINGQDLTSGDAVAIADESHIQTIGKSLSEFLLFDLP
jgi:redox-sensitive bicupin YhaK (pirin superfamily)